MCTYLTVQCSVRSGVSCLTWEPDSVRLESLVATALRKVAATEAQEALGGWVGEWVMGLELKHLQPAIASTARFLRFSQPGSMLAAATVSEKTQQDTAASTCHSYLGV